ncbi:MAG: D-alanine--D-alanine ligase [Kiritimatiellae bacterium]|nr:D-alanine--D-alanine ligase [Kiritimatiellia bacterium]
MSRKIRVAVLFGGRSAEHEVSLQSARNVVGAIDTDKYDVVLVGIDKRGQWRLHEAARFLLEADDPKRIHLHEAADPVALVPGAERQELVRLSDRASAGPVDVVFPVLHGPFGEDGTVQGLLKLADLPFVGAGVLGSAVGMDKDVMKRLLRDAGIPSPRFLVAGRRASRRVGFEQAARELGLPVFVKPANLGSSVGVHKVRNAAQFDAALDDALTYDTKLLIEECIEGREIECSVLGNDEPVASLPGEVVPQHEFYSYAAKYIDENGALLKIPAELPGDVTRTVQELAVKAFKALCCEGMARVDFFLRNGRDVFVNEINTIPGFTRISMYPKLWEASGVPCGELIDRLIQLALERFGTEKRLRTSFDFEGGDGHGQGGAGKEN